MNALMGTEAPFIDLHEIKNRDNPRAIINLVSLNVQKAIEAIPEHVFHLSIKDLEETPIVRKYKKEIDMMRTAFWLEFNRAQKTLSPILVAQIYQGVCGSHFFNKTIVTNSFALAYIMTPPMDYTVQQHRMLQIAQEKEMEILEMDHTMPKYNKDGEQVGEKIDVPLLNLKSKIAEALRNRIMGMPVARTMQINKNINTTVTEGEPDLESMSLDEIMEYADKMRAQIKTAEAKSGAIDVEPKNKG